jgi:hypothetical protein
VWHLLKTAGYLSSLMSARGPTAELYATQLCNGGKENVCFWAAAVFVLVGAIISALATADLRGG